MERRAIRDADWDDDGDDDQEEGEEEGDLPTVDCPYCGWRIPEDVSRCPYCEQYLSEEDAARPAARKPWWIVAGALACLYVIYRWIAG